MFDLLTSPLPAPHDKNVALKPRNKPQSALDDRHTVSNGDKVVYFAVAQALAMPLLGEHDAMPEPVRLVVQSYDDQRVLKYAPVPHQPLFGHDALKGAYVGNTDRHVQEQSCSDPPGTFSRWGD